MQALEVHSLHRLIFRQINTDDFFDFAAVLFDEIERQYPDCNYFLIFGYDTFINFGEGTFTYKVFFFVLVLPIFEYFSHLVRISGNLGLRELIFYRLLVTHL
jgi:hypothetical protein